MTTCEECGGEYPPDLSHCPHCAVVALEAEARRDVGVLRGAVGVVEVLILGFVLLASQLAYAAAVANSTPGSANLKSNAATTSYANTDAGSWVPVHGEVLLVLTIPKSAMGGAARAQASAHGLARTVFDTVPTASSVAVFDGNTSLIGRYRR